MYLIEKCPSCSGDLIKKHPAVLSPFVSNYASINYQGELNLNECENCHLILFDYRYDEPEVERLYAGYRGNKYFKTRNRYEFWYTQKINNSIGKDEIEIQGRKEFLSEYLKKWTNVADIYSVLDYGGDEGQFIPDDIGVDRNVYDISGMKVKDGVKKLKNLQEMNGKTFDLVMLCHVLEHCSDPKLILNKVKLLVKNNKYIYLELPYERIDYSRIKQTGFYNFYLFLLKKIHFLFTLADFYSTFFRVKFNKIPFMGIIKMHEHINYFDVQSLKALIESNEMEVIDCRVNENKKSWGINKIIACLVRVK